MSKAKLLQCWPLTSSIFWMSVYFLEDRKVAFGEKGLWTMVLFSQWCWSILPLGENSDFLGFLLFLILNLFFNWRIIALQNCVGFCQTSIWVIHMYMYVPSLFTLLPTFLPTPPLEIVTEPQYEFPESYSKFQLAIYFTYGNVSFHVTLSHTSVPLLPPNPLPWIFDCRLSLF